VWKCFPKNLHRGQFSASIELENLGTLGAKDVKVTLKGLTVDGFILSLWESII